MVAVITRSTSGRVTAEPRPHLVLIPGGQEASPVSAFFALPALATPEPHSPTGFRVVARPRRSVLRHWKVAVGAVVLLAVVAGGWILLHAIGGLAGGGSLASSGVPVAGPVVGGYPASETGGDGYLTGVQTSGAAADHPTQGHSWVVRPGDTLWGIVEAAGVRGDPRPVVDKLNAQLGGRSLQVGQTITVP